MNEAMNIHEVEPALFRAAILGRPVAIVVRILGSEYKADGPEYRLRTGRVEYIDSDKGYFTLELSNGYRNARLSDVMMLTML